MIVRTWNAAPTAGVFERAASREMVTPSDAVGHAIYDTRIAAGEADRLTTGASAPFEAQAHYCVAGEGTVSIDGRCWPIAPDTIVAARADALIAFTADSDLRICSIFAGDTPVPAETPALVRSVAEIEGTPRDVFWGNGQSRRLLVRSDGFGFALCQTLGNAQTDSPLQYRHHFESCYYVAGSGEYVWGDGRHPIDTNGAGGTVFIMNENDAHRMVVDNPSMCLSVFTPPIEGHESHDFTGKRPSSY